MASSLPKLWSARTANAIPVFIRPRRSHFSSPTERLIGSFIEKQINDRLGDMTIDQRSTTHDRLKISF
jgi:hypothetical protein